MSLEGKAAANAVLRGRINGLDTLTMSAYAIAVKNGFEGTEEEWLASLKGEKGDAGDSCTITATETEDGVRLGIYNTPSGGGSTYTPVLIKHGEKGDPGTSVTVKAVAESTADGGINMVTFSDGKTLTIKNGSKGDPGAVSEDQIAAAVEAYLAEHPVSSGSVVRVAEVELIAANWVGDASPYSQVVSIPSVTQYSQVDLTPSVEQLAIFHDKDLAFVTENEDGVVTVYAIGDKPSNDYMMQVTIKEVEVIV